MIILKRPPVATLAIFVISLLLQLLFFQSISLLHTINITFIFSMFLLFVGFFLAAARAGTFDSIQLLFFRLIHRNQSSFEEQESLKKWSDKIQLSYLFPLRVGFAVFFISMVLLAIYYFI